MARSEVKASFVLRLVSLGDTWRYELRDVRTGERLEFASWAALRAYLERRATQRGGLR